VQLPAWSTQTLSGTEDFPSAADSLLTLVDAVWCTPESPLPGSVKLDLWQRWLIRHILEMYPIGHPRAGQLRYRQVLVSMGRQNGKSLISSILAVWGLLREPGAVVIGVASTVDQARIIYDRVKFTTEAVPQLAKRFTRSSVTRGLETTTHSTYELKASKSAAVQGIPVSVGLPDELHLTRKEMWQALVNGTASRSNGIVVGITTAGDSGSELLIDLYDRARKATEDPDSRMGVFVWEAPDASLPADDETLAEYLTLANPTLAEGRLDIETVISDCRSLPAADVIRYRLNRFVDSSSSWLSPGTWQMAGGAVDLADGGRDLVWGIDQATDGSVCSITANFADDDGQAYTALVASLVEPRHDDVIALCNGLARMSQRFALEKSPGNKKILEALKSRHPTILYREDACAASMMLHRRLVQGKLTHNRDPLLTQQVNAALHKNVGLDWRLTRGKDNKPIDALMATAAGIWAVDTAPTWTSQLFV
jgi:phage terminase large subunit-like protein